MRIVSLIVFIIYALDAKKVLNDNFWFKVIENNSIFYHKVNTDWIWGISFSICGICDQMTVWLGTTQSGIFQLSELVNNLGVFKSRPA